MEGPGHRSRGSNLLSAYDAAPDRWFRLDLFFVVSCDSAIKAASRQCLTSREMEH